MVVGAGIGGLAAALSLRRAGWDVRVVEQAASPRELGFALALAPNALAALDELGLRDLVMSRGVEVKSFEVRRPDGRAVKRVVLHGAAMQSIVLLRSALHGTLLEAVGSDALLLGRRVAGLTTLPVSADVIIGADGVGSTIRRALHPDETPPRASGYHAVRGVSEVGGDALGDTDFAVYLGDGIEIGLAKASRTAIYWYISLVDEFAGADAPGMLDRCTHGLDDRAVAIIRAAPAASVRHDQLFTRAPLARLGDGNVTLLGDAAHPVLPHTAQGAALALEDAVALGLVLRHGGDPVAALRRYEDARAPRTRRVIGAGPRIAALTTTRKRSRIVLRQAGIRLVPGAVVSWALNSHARDPHRELRKSPSRTRV
ncbi:MAG TPA: FAD-dependent monooxygenase [Vicinamibacterales bacterium]|nr:FAD-dependent monooxygenase [Vicinamibacterales bacterium]